MVKKNKKRARDNEENENLQPTEEIPPPSRMSDEPPPKKVKWINKQRVLVLASRGITHRDRHLMEDLKMLMPHSKPDSKMEKKEALRALNEICEMKNCNKCIFFEGRKKKDLYMWISNVPRGPSAKFLVENVHTMGELKMTGNCLKGSRPLLSFDDNFSSMPHYALLKEILVQMFSTPNHHPKSQPFIDHVLTFSILDNRIWFRNFQILEEGGALAEIGPRFVLNPIKIFEGSFGGQTLWENSKYVTPNLYRQRLKKAQGAKYVNSTEQKLNYELTKPKEPTYHLNVNDEVFAGEPMETALEIQQREEKEKKKQKEQGEKKKRKKIRTKKIKGDKILNGVGEQNEVGKSGNQNKEKDAVKSIKKKKLKKNSQKAFKNNEDVTSMTSAGKTKPQMKKKTKKSFKHKVQQPSDGKIKKTSPNGVVKRKFKFNKKFTKQKTLLNGN